jgi:hypothetical protein
MASETPEPHSPVDFGTLLRRIAEEAPRIDEKELVYIYVMKDGLPTYYLVSGVSVSVSLGENPGENRIALVIDAGDISSVG